MLKVTQNNPPKDDSIKSYPCIGKSRYADTIILFSKKDCGCVLSSSFFETGKYCEEWDTETFSLYTGKIGLENF